LIVEFSITIDSILESITSVIDELEPDPIPDPHLVIDELLAVTNEFKISKLVIVEYPLVNEPPPIPEPIYISYPLHVAIDQALALTADS
jgi:hypothetical protein